MYKRVNIKDTDSGKTWERKSKQNYFSLFMQQGTIRLIFFIINYDG